VNRSLPPPSGKPSPSGARHCTRVASDGTWSTALAVVVATALCTGTGRGECRAAGDRFPDTSRHRERFVNGSGDVRLQVLDWGGGGPLLLFVPGLGQTAHIFDGLAPRMTDRYHVVGLTRRGHGRSDAPPSGYDLDTLVADLARVLPQLGYHTVTLVGHSFAGVELTTFAVRFPEAVERLVYIEAAYDFSQMPDSASDPVATTPTTEDLRSVSAGRAWFERVFGFWHEAVGADANEVNVLPDGRLKVESMRPDVASALWNVMTTLRPDYAAVAAPILAIYAWSETHPLLPRDAPSEQVSKANAFWRTKWLPYQRDSIAQVLAARAATTITILRGTQHLCFLRPADESQVAAAMRAVATP
jgi:non-heme chloroperoxidase